MLKISTSMKLAVVRLLGVVLMMGTALVGMVSPTHAEATITGYTHEMPASFLLESACASSGQEEDISVNLTNVARFFRVADAGGNFHWSLSEMWKDVTAVGVNSGNKYQVHFRSRAMMNTGTAAREFTSSYNMMLIGPNGDSNVYTYSIRAHYTMNADGTLVNYSFNTINECR